MSGGYDAISKRVNATYAETRDIRETMRETRLPFDIVWEMVGYADYFAFEGDED
jgi:hypothetical protein